MDDLEDDLKKFAEDEERLKPIDFGGKPATPPGEPARAPGAEAALPPEPAETKGPATGAASEQAPRRNTRDADLAPSDAAPRREEPNYIKRGQYIDLIEKVPTLKRIVIGGGWEQNGFEGDRVDVDLSLFLLNKNEMTRIDEDFIFYNNPRACDGAIQHRGDSRAGAGLGDDEAYFIDLNGLPFDIMKILCVFSVYDPEIQGHHFGMVRDLYLRIVNKDDGEEIFRFRLDEQDKQSGTAMIVGTLIREGPKWIYEASANLTNGGLAKFATDYGIIVKELQSTLDVEDEAPGDSALPET